jgi:hypothetical protein
MNLAHPETGEQVRPISEWRDPHRAPARRSAEIQQLLHGHPDFVQNLSKSTRSDLLVIRHDDAGIRTIAPEDYVAASLAANNKTRAKKHLYQLLSGISAGSFTDGCWSQVRSILFPLQSVLDHLRQYSLQYTDLLLRGYSS